MMIAMTAALLIAATPAPALAQSSANPADQDAMCFIVMTALIGRLSDQPDKAQPGLPDRLQRGVGFYVSRLAQRAPGKELEALVKGADTAVFAMTYDQQMDLVAKCDDAQRTAYDRVVAAVRI